eukprot:TRINITY_DN8589_c1_g9_i1.p1 TRINITY_DN8589_c1_g9~~TRINITY_DN8589_c1_g9_i1.p1  ORF type:complete len:220 (-),score=51.45 TRINITY_DN8589_c1_g9_i1:226-885(-)
MCAPTLSWETAGAGQHRLLRVIGRLAALSGRDLDGGDLARLEACVARLEKPGSPCTPLSAAFDCGLLPGSPFGDAAPDSNWSFDASPLSKSRRPTLLASPAEVSRSGGDDEILRPSPTKVPKLDLSHLAVPLDDQLATALPPDASATSPAPAPASADWACASGAGGAAADTVDVEVTVPDGSQEGGLLAVNYEGLNYEVPVPAGCRPGSTFCVALLSAR